jgi:hypothetical protein
MPRKLSALLGALFILSIITSACSGASAAAPTQPGQYAVQKDSVHFDGDRYSLYYADNAGALHRMETRNLKMVRDPERTYLDVQNGSDPVLHLREDEPITVDGRDREGAFGSPWFPFLAGTLIGRTFGGGGGGPIIINNPAPGERNYDAGTPAYRYPPTGTFGRGDQLNGSLDSGSAKSPDYSKVKPSPYATSGQNSGTGGGVAASNKSVTSGASNAASGQSGGTGSGVAATNKGGFSSGTQAYTPSGSSGAGSSGALKGGGSSGTLTGKPSTSVKPPSGGKGIGGSRSGGRR